MGNTGTDGADEARHDSRDEEPQRPRADRDPRQATPPAADGEPPDAIGDEGGTGPIEPANVRPTGAPEWPLTKENQIVEAANPSGPTRGWGPAAPEQPRRATDEHPQPGLDADTTAASPPGTGEPSPAASDGPRHAAAKSLRHSRSATDAPPAAANPIDSADDTTVLPAATAPDDTAILPGFDEPRGRAQIPTEAPPPNGFLVAQGLSATGPEGPIFSSVSLTAELGEIVTIVGDSGTGRTALLLALSGRFKCQAGTLTVAGDQRPSRIRDAVAIAWAPPAVMFDDNHTVAAVLSESALVGDTGEAEVRRRCDDLRLDLDTGAAFGRLSRVERTLLAMASAWAADVPVIAVDDLDSGVDDAGTVRLWEAARVIADDRRLVLATAVRAGTAGDRVVHPRPLTTSGGHPPR